MDKNLNESQSEENSEKGTEKASSAWWGSWGQEWIDSVKEKSASTLQMVKNDLNEFVEVIQGDTSVAIADTASKLDEQVKENEDNVREGMDVKTKEMVKQGVKGISQVLHSLSDLMSIQEPDDSNEEFITLSDDKFSLQSYNRKQEKLHNMQVDPGTYCNEPEGAFSDWIQVFSLDDNKEDMSNLLTQNHAIRALYSQLVPSVVSHTTFWQRYYYQVFLVESEERKREELLARASSAGKPKDVDEDEGDGGWDDEDDIEIVNPDMSTKEVLPSSRETVKDVIIDVISTSTDDKNACTKEEINSLSKMVQGAIVEPPPQTIHDTEPFNMNRDLQITRPKLSDSTNERNNSIKNNPDSTGTCSKSEQNNSNQNSDSMDNPIKFENEADKQSISTLSLDQPSSESSAFSMLDAPANVTSNLQPTDVSSKESSTFSMSDSPTNLTPTLQPTDVPSNETSALPTLDTPSHESNGISETASVSSWLSIDDDIKVKKIKGDQVAKEVVQGRPISDGGSSSTSSGVLVNKSEADDLDNDFDMDIDDDDDDDDDDVNEEELAKMVADIKTKSAAGTLQDDDDDDWENWE